MGKAAFATVLCLLLAVPATAGAAVDVVDLAALRDAGRLTARVATDGVVPLPLPGDSKARASTASPGELTAIARSPGPVRVLVGASTHAAVPGIAAALRRLGGRPEVFADTGVVAAAVPSGAALARLLGADPRVAYIERDRALRVSTDPYDTVDATPGGSGIKFTWGYDEVRAAGAILAAGGGSRHRIAVVDTGADVNNPELAGRIAGRYDIRSKRATVADRVGHGTFVSGLISAVDGNGIGGKGAAGNTKLLEIRASLDGSFTVSDLVAGIEASVRRHVAVINLSLAGQGFSISQLRALRLAFYNDVLPVAASGNNGDTGNPLEFPAAALGGPRGQRGIGLSVSATRPGGASASFSTHNDYVSLAAPGAGATGCELGVFSILPASTGTEWDDPLSCSLLFTGAGGRYAYGEGTSFAAPFASAMAALAWQVQPRLASEQVADVLIRSARQTVGRGWNQLTGAGVVDGTAAAALAKVYDVSPPPRRGTARRRGGSSVGVHIGRTHDRTLRGHELAGHLRYGLLVSRDGGQTFKSLIRRRQPLNRVVQLKGSGVNVLVASVCDANGNCGLKRLGRYRRY